MTGTTDYVDPAPMRRAMAGFEISPRVEPNETIDLERVLFPDGHRNVLDMKRQLAVGNRGMGKSFWTHALTNQTIRERLSRAYSFPALARTDVAIGFNGSIKISGATPTIEDIQRAYAAGNDPKLIWRTAILRAFRSGRHPETDSDFLTALDDLKARPGSYAAELTSMDDLATERGEPRLVVFDALDRLSHDWAPIRDLTKGLLLTVLDLQSFRSIRAKVFMRVDQFADTELFQFPDSSKIRNDHVDLSWKATELYGLLFFELMRDPEAKAALEEIAKRLNVTTALPSQGRLIAGPETQQTLVAAIAGEYMGKGPKRGLVYSWVPLHLGDAKNNCSPRTFLTAWKTAAEHNPAPQRLVVDHLGLNEGVRRASSARLSELREDYPYIDIALEPLRRQFVPIEKASLFELWRSKNVAEGIRARAGEEKALAPIGVSIEGSEDALLRTLTSIAVMEERANGKINVPDIFRVEAEILRKGGVAVPRK